MTHFALISWLEAYAPTLVMLLCGVLVLSAIMFQPWLLGSPRMRTATAAAAVLATLCAVNSTWYLLSLVGPALVMGQNDRSAALKSEFDTSTRLAYRKDMMNAYQHSWCKSWVFYQNLELMETCAAETGRITCVASPADNQKRRGTIYCKRPQLPKWCLLWFNGVSWQDQSSLIARNLKKFPSSIDHFKPENQNAFPGQSCAATIWQAASHGDVYAALKIFGLDSFVNGEEK